MRVFRTLAGGLLPAVFALSCLPAAAADTYSKTIPVGQKPAVSAPAPVDNDDIWLTINLGRYGAKDYPTGPDTTHDGTHIGGGEAAVALQYAWVGTGTLLRLRTNYLTDFTSNTAEETALEGGIALDPQRKAWFAVGVSRLSDVSNRHQSPDVGVPVELIYYPLRGLELTAHANFNDERKFFGVTIGWAIGHRPAR